MNAPIKFILMFLASLGAFVILASLDEYEDVIAPFLKKEIKREETVEIPQTEDAIKSFIERFHSVLSDIYLSAEPYRVEELPAEETIKRVVAEEIAFLANSGKVMNMAVSEIVVEGIERLSSYSVKVKTVENVSLSYLNLSDRKAIAPVQIAEHQIIYTIGVNKFGWNVVSFDTVNIDRIQTNFR